MYYSKKECNNLINEWLIVNAQLKELESRKDELTKELVKFYEHMEKDSKEKVNTSLYEFKPIYMLDQKKFSEKAFKEAYPDLYESFKKPIKDYSYFRSTSFRKVGGCK